MCSLHLAPNGVYMTAQSPGRRCALTAPFHPYRNKLRRYLSVALALESPPPAVNWHPALRCPDFPHTLRHAAIQPPLSRGVLYPFPLFPSTRILSVQNLILSFLCSRENFDICFIFLVFCIFSSGLWGRFLRASLCSIKYSSTCRASILPSSKASFMAQPGSF